MCTTSTLSVDGHLGCFHVLAIVNSAAVNIGVRVSLEYMYWGANYSFVWVCMPRSGIAGSYNHSLFHVLSVLVKGNLFVL